MSIFRVIPLVTMFLLTSLEHATEPKHEDVISRSPKAYYRWKEIPEVRVCKSAPVSRSRVEKALRFWRNLGYEFDGPFFDDESAWCIGERDIGVITIDIIGQDFKEPNMAMTRVYHDTRYAKIVGAQIQIKKSQAGKDRVLEHEIGHALGWKHHPRRFHIMHPDWKEGGWDTKGLRKSDILMKVPASFDKKEIIVYED